MKVGRITLMDPEPVEGDERDPDEIKKELEKLDPSEPRLKPITEDAKVTGGQPAWQVRQYGDRDSYVSANPANGKVNYGVVVAKSF